MPELPEVVLANALQKYLPIWFSCNQFVTAFTQSKTPLADLLDPEI
jgi:hypothetical protein